MCFRGAENEPSFFADAISRDDAFALADVCLEERGGGGGGAEKRRKVTI